MVNIGIRVTGFDKVLAQYKQIPKKLVEEVDMILADAATRMVNKAVNDAPVDQGRLRNGITLQRRKLMDYIVVSDAEWSAFIEFGTRSRVQVPGELQEVAAQFRGGGGGGDVKRVIYDWCSRKGIAEKLRWPIFISIMTKGIHPHPFFFKNFFAVKGETLKELKSAFKRIANG